MVEASIWESLVPEALNRISQDAHPYIVIEVTQVRVFVQQNARRVIAEVRAGDPPTGHRFRVARWMQVVDVDVPWE